MSVGLDRTTTIFRALVTSSVFWVAEIDHPTIFLEWTSKTVASNKNPAEVGTKVMSATHRSFGPFAVKSRSRRSGAGLALLSRLWSGRTFVG